MKHCRLLIFLILLLFQIQAEGQGFKYLTDPEGLSGITETNGINKPVTVKVVYDNYVKQSGLKADWGYSIVIEGLDKNVLFDTGTKPEIFESNFNKMNIDPDKIDLIAISHEHRDHYGGIYAFVKMKNNIPVIFPHSFSDSFMSEMAGLGLEPRLIRGPVKICEHLYSSGEFPGPIPEHALVLNMKKGLVVMTGCSHPGINEMIKGIKSSFNKNVYMVFGGFHLNQKSEQETEEIIKEMKSLGVVKCGATHCTGDKQIKMFRDSFGEDYFEVGVGNIIVIK